MFKKLGLVLLLVGFVATPALAADCAKCHGAKQDAIKTKVKDMDAAAIKGLMAGKPIHNKAMMEKVTNEEITKGVK